MGNRTNRKYYILIVVFTVIFFLCMVFCFMRFRALSQDHKFRSLSYRLETIEMEERMYGSSHIFSSLYYSKNYEEEFDGYWAFCDAYLAYVRGRYAEEKAPYIETLQEYLNTAPADERERVIKGYLEELENP